MKQLINHIIYLITRHYYFWLMALPFATAIIIIMIIIRFVKNLIAYILTGAGVAIEDLVKDVGSLSITPSYRAFKKGQKYSDKINGRNSNHKPF